MENLKSFMGSAYHDGLTVDEVNAFLDGKKYVNLKDGGYIAKDKFDKLSADHEELITKTKDYETVVKEHGVLKAEKEAAETRKSLIDAGVNEKFVDYVQFNIEKGKIAKDDKFVENVKGFLKENPQYATQVQKTPKTVFTTKVETNPIGGSNEKGGEANPVNATINDAIRGIASGTSK